MADYSAGGLGAVDFWRRLRDGRARAAISGGGGVGYGGGGGGGGGWDSLGMQPSLPEFGLYERPKMRTELGGNLGAVPRQNARGYGRMRAAEKGNVVAGSMLDPVSSGRLERRGGIGRRGNPGVLLGMSGEVPGLAGPVVGDLGGGGVLQRNVGGMPDVGAGGEMLPGLDRRPLRGSPGVVGGGPVAPALGYGAGGVGVPDRTGVTGSVLGGGGGSAIAPGLVPDVDVNLGGGQPRRMRPGVMGPRDPSILGLGGPELDRAAVGGGQYGRQVVDGVTGAVAAPGGGYSGREVRGLMDPLGVNDPRNRGMVPGERAAYADAAAKRAELDAVNAGLLGELTEARAGLASEGYRSEGAAMADADIARMSRASALGYNPGGMVGSGVMRGGVFTPGPRMADVPERESEREMREWDAGVDARLTALNLERGVAMDAARDARTTPEAIAAGRARAVGRRGLTGDPVLTADQFMNARKDISDEQRQAYFDRLAARDAKDAMASTRRVARAQERAGTVFGPDGQVDRQASALARLNQLDPNAVADIGIRQQEADARGGIDRMNAEANLRIGQARAIEAGMDPALVAGAGGGVGMQNDDLALEERISRGIELDGLGPDQRAVNVRGILANVMALPDDQQQEQMRKFGLREDHLEEIVKRAEPGFSTIFQSQADIDRLRYEAAEAQRALDILRGTAKIKATAGKGNAPLSPQADVSVRRNTMFPPSESSIVAERNRQERLRERNERLRGEG